MLNHSEQVELTDFVHFTPQEQALQADGKILVAGYGKSVLAQGVAGYNPILINVLTAV